MEKAREQTGKEKNMMLKIKAMGACVVSVITYLYGGLDKLFYILLACIIADYITGICAAVKDKKLSSRTGFLGILKKVCILIVVSTGVLIGQAAGIDEIRSLVMGFYIANEGISILENAGRLGVPFPQKLMDALEQLKEDK
jgi:toxin secretion/phage lysis holin